MDIKELKTFLTLSQTLNYQKAAESLSFAPSTLNRHIQILESELGAKLFMKQGKWLSITPEGETFINYAQRIVELFEESLVHIGSSDKRNDTLSIGGTEIALVYGFSDLLSAYSKASPHVRLTIQTSTNAQILEMVQNGNVEIGYYYSMDSQPIPSLHSKILFSEPVQLVASPANPLSALSAVHYSDLANASFAFGHDDCCANIEFLNRLQVNGIPTGRVFYLGSMHLMIERAFEHNAILIVNRSTATYLNRQRGLRILNLNEDPLQLWAHILCKDSKSLSFSAKSLWRHSLFYTQNLTYSCESLPSFSII